MQHSSYDVPPPGSGREEGVALTGLVALFAITAAWWALALWPVQDGPAWLERTRYVCFGVAESGLPDAGGWIGLIGGPLGMLAVLVVGWGRGVRRLLLRARTSRAVAGALAGLVLGTALMVGGAGYRVRQAEAAAWSAGPEAGALPAPDYPRLDRDAPPLDLVDHTGARFSLDALRGRPVILTFAYAHCATVCPLLVQDALRARETAPGPRPAVVVVTLDPWRDTPASLPGIARSWGLGADAWLLGGEPEAVTAALGAWMVPFSRDERTGEVTHPSLVYVLDADGRIAYASTGGAGALAELIRRL